jgi:hypothetical protein
MTDRRFLREIDRAALQQERDLARLMADGLGELSSLDDLGELSDEDKALFTGPDCEQRQRIALIRARQERKRAVKAAWYQRTKQRRKEGE